MQNITTFSMACKPLNMRPASRCMCSSEILLHTLNLSPLGSQTQMYRLQGYLMVLWCLVYQKVATNIITIPNQADLLALAINVAKQGTSKSLATKRMVTLIRTTMLADPNLSMVEILQQVQLWSRYASDHNQYKH